MIVNFLTQLLYNNKENIIYIYLLLLRSNYTNNNNRLSQRKTRKNGYVII